MDNAPSQPVGGSTSRAQWIAFLVAATFFMEMLDGTVIATALPDMAKSFHRAPVDLNIGMSAYLLTLAVFIPISGWVADRFGPRPVFATAIVIFTLASLACGLSDNLATFTAMRIVQGAGGALMVPVGRLLVLRNTPKTGLMSAIATITWPGLVAPVLGPPVGGALSAYASWRWIFYLNLPLGALALIVAVILIPRAGVSERRAFDWPGFVLSGVGFLCVMYGMECLGRESLAWMQVIACLLAGAVLLFFAARHMGDAARVAAPMIDLTPLSVRSFAVTIWGGSLFRISIGVVPFLLPLMFQLGFGIDAFHSGLLVLAVFAGNLAMKPGTSAILRRFGFRSVLIVNGWINALTLLATAFLTPAVPTAVIVVVLFLGGMSRSMQFTALNTIAFVDVPPARMSGANTLFSTAQQLSTGMGIAVGAIALRAGHALYDRYGAGGAASTHQGLSVRLGESVPLMAFHLAFCFVAVIGLLAIVDCLTLSRDAGHQLAGARRIK